MIFGNFSKKHEIKNNIKKPEVAPKTGIREGAETMTKKRAKQFFDKIRQEMPEKGDFPVIVNEFKDDKTGSEYRLFITPSHIKGEENIRRLSLGYKIPDTGYMRSVQILKGTKVDILDYIGNEGNLGQIEAYIKMLKESSDN